MTVCKICGNDFTGNIAHTKYCSDECYNAGRKISRQKCWQKYRDRNREMARTRYWENRDSILAKQRKFREENPSYVPQAQQKYHRSLKQLVLSHYANPIKCFNCGRTELEVLALHHLDNDGGVSRDKIDTKTGGSMGYYRYLKKNNFPEQGKIQILCHNCHFYLHATGKYLEK